MAAHFLDSSALAKLYHSELGTAVVEGIVNDSNNQVRISRLTAVELQSVFAIKVRTKFISRDDARALSRQFREDIVSGKFEIFGLRETELNTAERLIERHALDQRLRALDAIQIAVALALRSQGLIDHFVAADKVLCDVAEIEGLSVINPESP